MFVKTLLSWILVLSIYRANVEDKVTPVVGRNVNIYIYCLSHGIGLPYNSITILSSCLNSKYFVKDSNFDP